MAFGIVAALFSSAKRVNISSCVFSSSSALDLCIQHCDQLDGSSHLLALFYVRIVSVSLHPLFFFSLPDYVRECIVGTGQSYRGRRSVTVTGILCQAWASPIPHEHKYGSNVLFTTVSNKVVLKLLFAVSVSLFVMQLASS